MLIPLINVFILLLAAQSGTLQKFPPSVGIDYPNYEYRHNVPSLDRIDFRNFDLVIFHFFGKRNRYLNLRNGEYHEREYMGGTDASLERVRLFGAESGAPKYVLLSVSEVDWGGSSSETGIVQVLKVENHRLCLLQQFIFDLQAPGTGVAFDAKAGNLTITDRSNDDSAHCCAKHVDVVRFHWDGQHFQKLSTCTVAVSPANK